MGFLLVGTYWPWANRERAEPGQTGSVSREAAPPSNGRIRAVIRGHDGRIQKLTEVPDMNPVGDARTRVVYGIKEKSGRGVSLLFPSVTVNIHL